jgi:hypothetical protein
MSPIPIELEIQSDSEVESLADGSYEGSSVSEEEVYPQRKKEDGANRVKDIAKGDSLRVQVWKTLVLLTMVTLTSCVSAGAYYFLKKEENDDYLDSVRMTPPCCRRRGSSRQSEKAENLTLAFVSSSYSINYSPAPFATRSKSMSSTLISPLNQ